MEIEILRKLKGEKGVVALLAVYDDYKDVCLVLRLEEGMSLKAFIGKNLPVPEDQMRIILLNLLTTLAMVHSLHIVHRDIKPDNIIINPAANFTPCLLDFGLATDLMALQNKQICGTPGYIAPETLRGEVGDARVDVYGLGMVGWTMAKGKNPFVGGDRRETLMRNREGRVEGEGVGELLRDLLGRMTSPDPSSRPTVSECIQHPWFSEESCPDNQKPLLRLSSMDSDFSTAAEDRPPLAANRD